jgi:hypothetical protein
MTLKYRILSSEGEALIPGAAVGISKSQKLANDD